MIIWTDADVFGVPWDFHLERPGLPVVHTTAAVLRALPLNGPPTIQVVWSEHYAADVQYLLTRTLNDYLMHVVSDITGKDVVFRCSGPDDD